MTQRCFRALPFVLVGGICLTNTSCVSILGERRQERPSPPPIIRHDGTASGLTSGNEALRRQGAEAYAIRCMNRADSELKQNRFENAAVLYRDAIKNLSHRPDDDPRYKRATAGLGETYYRWARALEKARDDEGAMKMARRAAVHGHPGAHKLYKRLERRQ